LLVWITASTFTLLSAYRLDAPLNRQYQPLFYQMEAARVATAAAFSAIRWRCGSSTHLRFSDRQCPSA
jgi:hypothetical protein